jgi:hypothetical protein
MQNLNEKIIAEIEQLTASSLREFCVLLLSTCGCVTADPADTDPEREKAILQALGAVFCARGLCRTYSIKDPERDVVLAASFCCALVEAIGWAAAKEVIGAAGASEAGASQVISMVESSCQGRGGRHRYDELLHSGQRTEIVVALSLILRRTIFSIPVARHNSSPSEAKCRPRAGKKRRVDRVSPVKDG